jgi:hypothetical protein
MGKYGTSGRYVIWVIILWVLILYIYILLLIMGRNFLPDKGQKLGQV